MPVAKIEDLLHRRTDLSTFLVHLTKATPGATARENLVSMIAGGDDEPSAIHAVSSMGPARDYESFLATTVATQKVVCLTETPLEHIWMMLEDIEGRTVHFEPWGLATTKTAARHAGCSPVWYTNKAAFDWSTHPRLHVQKMIEDAVRRSTTDGSLDPMKIDASTLCQEPVFRITPFVEDMGPNQSGTFKEFWWEREWRHVGDYSLNFPSRIVAILAPENEHVSLYQQLQDLEVPERWLKRPMIDPHWGLERVIAELARVNEEYIGPFPGA